MPFSCGASDHRPSQAEVSSLVMYMTRRGCSPPFPPSLKQTFDRNDPSAQASAPQNVLAKLQTKWNPHLPNPNQMPMQMQSDILSLHRPAHTWEYPTPSPGKPPHISEHPTSSPGKPPHIFEYPTSSPGKPPHMSEPPPSSPGKPPHICEPAHTSEPPPSSPDQTTKRSPKSSSSWRRAPPPSRPPSASAPPDRPKPRRG